MDDLAFLKRIMAQHPIPVVICSSPEDTSSETAIKALEYRAVDVIKTGGVDKVLPLHSMPGEVMRGYHRSQQGGLKP